MLETRPYPGTSQHDTLWMDRNFKLIDEYFEQVEDVLTLLFSTLDDAGKDKIRTVLDDLRPPKGDTSESIHADGKVTLTNLAHRLLLRFPE